MDNIPRRVPVKRISIIGIAIAAFIIILVLAGQRFFSPKAVVQTGSILAEDKRTAIQPAKSTIAIGREFSFPILNEKGAEVAKIKYIIESAELRDEIIIKGKRTTSVKGKTFLILNLKIGNETNKAIKINTRDYIRISLNNQDFLAPDIHNDPVDVQPISTKYTRVGLSVNDNEKKFKVQVGEINKEKTIIDLQLP